MNNLCNEQNLVNARELVAALESKDEQRVVTALSVLSKVNETYMFSQVCRITRELHDSLGDFINDPRFTKLAESDIPDAKQRLRHVVSLTQQAAHRTLSAVESSLPACAWIQEAVALPASEVASADTLRRLQQETAALQENLREITLAQEFQDITGQMIQHVIHLVESVENGLVKLIKITGEAREEHGKGERRTSEPNEAPQAVCNQDEVDDLLSSLGF